MLVESLVMDYYSDVGLSKLVLNCFIVESSKGNLLLLVYLQRVLIYEGLCCESVCVATR